MTEIDKMMHEVDFIKTKVETLTTSSESMQKEINDLSAISRRIEYKVFNGFGSRIDAINEKLERDNVTNSASHSEMKKSMAGLMKFISVALISIFVAMMGIMGTIWTSGNKNDEKLEKAMAELHEATECAVKLAEEHDEILHTHSIVTP